MSTLSHKRILVKFSGESVAGDDEHGIDPKILDSMASSVGSCTDLGVQIGIVIGGGNLFRGEKLSKAGMDRVAGDHMGMLATVMNGIALRDSLERALSKESLKAIPFMTVASMPIWSPATLSIPALLNFSPLKRFPPPITMPI